MRSSERKAQKKFDKFISKTLEVGPAFTDIVFSYLMGDMVQFERGYPGVKTYREGEGFHTVFRTPGGEIELDGYDMGQFLMCLVQEFGSEVVEQACKAAFISIGRTPTKNRFEPPQILMDDDLMKVTMDILAIKYPEGTCGSSTQPIK